MTNVLARHRFRNVMIRQLREVIAIPDEDIPDQ